MFKNEIKHCLVDKCSIQVFWNDLKEFRALDRFAAVRTIAAQGSKVHSRFGETLEIFIL